MPSNKQVNNALKNEKVGPGPVSRRTKYFWTCGRESRQFTLNFGSHAMGCCSDRIRSWSKVCTKPVLSSVLSKASSISSSIMAAVWRSYFTLAPTRGGEPINKLEI